MGEFHGARGGHLVLSEAEWDAVKRGAAEDIQYPGMTGTLGKHHGWPVYIDECPWDCKEPEVSP